MLHIATFWLIVAVASTYGHNNNNYGESLRDDGNLQADLMPQELNPAFEPQSKDDNRRAFFAYDAPQEMPIRPLVPFRTRIRRAVGEPAIGPDVAVIPDLPEPLTVTSIAEQVKQYSRVIACFVLIVSAAIEVVVYIVEAYQDAA